MTDRDRTERADLARAQGFFNLVGGLWPIVHRRSFEKVFGPKTDTWLELTVAGLLAAVGWSQLRAASSPESVRHARRIGIATAATLLAIDLIYVTRGRIRPTYLADAIAEAWWIKAWLRPAGPPAAKGPSRVIKAAPVVMGRGAPVKSGGKVGALTTGCATAAALVAYAVNRRAQRRQAPAERPQVGAERYQPVSSG
ncbi:hypothetical protein [Thermobispora bispora]|uniref:hypothetical protein n=1 Tax=Thermobispora bispora TaxID=2006 RepID=UPI00197D4954|nr:hypothetical protein [Thermobispora bispora]